MQPSHKPVSPFLLWSWRTESPSCSTWQIQQHRPYFNHQRSCHCHPRNGHWNGSSPPKIGVGRSSILLTRCQWSSMVQGWPYGSEGLWTSPQDHGWGSLLSVFYPSENQQDVSRFEEKILVDENEARDSKVCIRVWHMSKSQGWSFETHWKPTTNEHSWVEMEKHLFGLHCGFASHLTWLQLNMGHCGPLD
jgi:hypothetical protein